MCFDIDENINYNNLFIDKTLKNMISNKNDLVKFCTAIFDEDNMNCKIFFYDLLHNYDNNNYEKINLYDYEIALKKCVSIKYF